MSERYHPRVGDVIILDDEPDCIVPAGCYEITSVNDDGSFQVDEGNTAVWSRRIVAVRG